MAFRFSLSRTPSRTSQLVSLAFILLAIDIIIIGYIAVLALKYF